MRWSYLAPRFVVLAIVWSFFAFFFDPLLRSAITAAANAAGAPVKVNGLATTLWPPALEIDRVQIANHLVANSNLVEFERLNLRIAGRPLLHRRLIVSDGSITGLQWGTYRDWDIEGTEQNESIDQAGANGESYRLGEVSDKISGIGKKLLNGLLDRLQGELDPQNLETVRLSQQLHTKWDQRFKEYELRSDDLRTRVDKIQTTVKNTKGNVFERIEAYTQAAEQARTLLNEVEAIRGEFPDLADDAGRDLGSINESRQRDLQQVQQKLRLENIQGKDLTQMLLGDEMAIRLNEAIEWIGWSKHMIARAQVEYEPQRSRGIDIVFPSYDDAPSLLVRRLKLAGVAKLGNEDFSFTGLVRGLTSDPATYGRPMRVRIAAVGTAQLKLDATLDYTGDTPIHHVGISYRQPVADSLTANDSGLYCHGKIRLHGDELSDELAVRQEPLVISVESLADVDERLRQGLTDVFSQIQRLEATVALSGSLDKPQWKLESTLGPELAAGINRVLNSELENHKQQLIAQVDQIVQEKTLGLQEMLNARYGSIVDQININDEQIRELTQIAQRVAGRPLNFNNIIRR